MIVGKFLFHRWTCPLGWLCLASLGLGSSFAAQSSGSAPFATTQPPLGVSSSNATLSGMVTPNGAATVAWFEWGTSTAYGQATTPAGAGSGTAATRASTNITSLL